MGFLWLGLGDNDLEAIRDKDQKKKRKGNRLPWQAVASGKGQCQAAGKMNGNERQQRPRREGLYPTGDVPREESRDS